MSTATEITRDGAIKSIRDALKRRSGKGWSVTGGRGTAWGWITIDAPPARRTWQHVPKPHNVTSAPGAENWDEIDTGEPGGHTGPQDRAELGTLLGLAGPVHTQGESIPASHDHWREYVDRAEGRPPQKIGQQYWD